MGKTNEAPYRVLFVSEMFWPFIGGAEISAFITLSNLANRGLRVSVLTHRFPETKPHEFQNGIAIDREKMLSERPLDIFRRVVFYSKAFLMILKYVVRNKPQVIIAQQQISPSAIALSRVFRIPVIVVIQDYWPICYNRTLLKPNGQICTSYDTNLKEIYACEKHGILLAKPRKLIPFLAAPQSILVFIHAHIVKHLMKKADSIVAISSFVKKTLIKNGFDSRRIKVIYNPVMAENQSESLTKEVGTVLYVGRLDLEKGVEFLLKAMQNLKMTFGEVKLVIAGTGKQEDYLRTMAKDLGIKDRVEFLGLFSHETIKRLYESSAIVVVPSIWAEPFGRVVVEAMAHGRPVVASNVGGIPELISSENGILIPPGDSAALADALASLISGKHEFKSNSAVLEKFLPDRIASLMFNLITETLEARSGEKR